MLPSPSSEGWTNVVYEMHEYQYGGSVSTVEQGSVNQVTDFNNHSSYDCPDYIGEWNDMGLGASVYEYSYNEYVNNGISNTIWAYKATAGLTPNGWGVYDPSSWKTTPNVSTSSEATIISDWAEWTTSNAFVKNSGIAF